MRMYSYVYRIIPEILKVSHLGQTPCVESQGLIPWAKSSTPLVPPRKKKKKGKLLGSSPVGHEKNIKKRKKERKKKLQITHTEIEE